MIRDAIEVTRALGIRYLWADCMCIIQNDDGQDWAHEAEAMAMVCIWSLDLYYRCSKERRQQRRPLCATNPIPDPPLPRPETLQDQLKIHL